MKLSDIGEFGLIERLRKNMRDPGKAVLVGPGDDTAVFGAPSGMDLLATCDAQVEGVHFSRDWASPFQIGRKAAAINISDIAAMGGKPLYILASVGSPAHLPVSFLEEVAKGLDHEAGLWGASIIGGNMANNPERLFIDLFVLGCLEKGRAILRSGAKPGDLICVTGFLGESAAGFHLLQRPETEFKKAERERLINAHLLPVPRVQEARALVQSGKVTASMDVSDGLLSDLGHILKASSVGAVLKEEKLPISNDCQEAARALGRDPLHWALGGGEDYELLFTVSDTDFPEIQKTVQQNCKTKIHAIGRVTENKEKIILLDENEKELSLDFPSGWDHF